MIGDIPDGDRYWAQPEWGIPEKCPYDGAMSVFVDRCVPQSEDADAAGRQLTKHPGYQARAQKGLFDEIR